MTRVVIIGGGVAGLEAANYLSRKGIRPVVVTSSEYYISGPSRPLILSNEQSLDRITRGYSKVKEYADVIFSKPLSVDPENRHVNLENGRTLEYDYLIVASGLKYDYSAIEGGEDVLNVYDIGRLFDLKNEVWNRREGNIVVYAPKQPYRCAPAPAETVLTIDMALRYRGVRENFNITFVDANPKVQPPVIHDVWVARLEEAGINVILGKEIVEVERDGVILSDGERVKADIKAILPPNVGVSPLGEGFLEVRGPYDLRTKKYEDIYAVGDVAKLPFPKNSEIASISARIAASQITEDAGAGEKLKETYRFVGWAYAGNLSGELKTESVYFELEFTAEGPRGKKDPEPKPEYTQTKDRWEQGVLGKLFGY